jgi:SOS-response transcriptional repressor LexA
MAKNNDVSQRFIGVFRELEEAGAWKDRKEVGAKLKCSPQVITEILGERMQVTIQILQNFFAEFGVNPAHVFLNEEPVYLLEKIAGNLAGKLRVSHRIEVNEAAEEYGRQLKNRVPLIAVEAFGGRNNSVFRIEDKDIQAHYVVPDFKDITFMIRVKGSSMYPKYASGDVVACRILKEKAFIQWGKVYVISTKEQGILIKRLKKGDGKTFLVAHSDNEKYDPFEIPLGDIDGYALVVGVIRLE